MGCIDSFQIGDHHSSALTQPPDTLSHFGQPALLDQLAKLGVRGLPVPHHRRRGPRRARRFDHRRAEGERSRGHLSGEVRRGAVMAAAPSAGCCEPREVDHTRARARRRFDSATAALPAAVRGPVLSPPCMRQRPPCSGRPVKPSQTARAWHWPPSRRRAPHSGRSRRHPGWRGPRTFLSFFSEMPMSRSNSTTGVSGP
jgi:hypothetical protein